MNDRIITRHSRTPEEQQNTIQTYYQLQSKIYDRTRWSFLFGRRKVITELPFAGEDAFHLLEVGCGTGYNLANLARRFPHARLTGLDLSEDMLGIARRNLRSFSGRIDLRLEPYGTGTDFGAVDAILFSYSLTMINPQWRELLAQARADLRPGGVIAVADFHDSRFSWFKAHMGNHHVRMDGHLLPVLQSEFQPLTAVVRPAYGGIWHYFRFVGRKG